MNTANKHLLVIDITLLVHHYALQGSTRSGIYFTSYNIILELLKSENFDVLFYLADEDLEKFKNLHRVFPDIQQKFKFYKNYRLACLYQKFNYKYARANNKLHKKCYKFMREVIRIAENVEKKCIHYDAFLSTFLKIPYQFKANRNFLIIYDAIPLIYPQYFDVRPDWFYELFDSLNTQDKYFCISESTKRDALRFRPDLDDKQFIVTPLAASSTFQPMHDKTKFSLIKQKYNIPENKKYMFSLCTLEPRKNLIRIIKSFLTFLQKNNINDMILCIGGGKWDAFASQLQKEFSSFPEYEKYILKMGYVDDEDIPYLYSNAEWFVYTSQYEGFGLPPLEAMACGCPVIASTSSSLPEVVGDAALTVEYDNEAQHIAAYETYYYTPSLREEFADKGLARSREFSWQKTAEIIEYTILETIRSTP